MRKKIFINALHPEESRVAIVEEGLLSEYEVEFAGREQQRGNIYKGIVVNTEPGLQAAFVNYGEERLGFLQVSEVNLAQIHGPNFSKPEGYPRIEQVLKPRQEILVQVVKDERGSKGAALTTYISLPGRYMVLMPFSDTRGVSRKIDSESQRKKIKETMASFELPEHTGYIVRTAAVGRKKEELRKDIDYLLRINEKVLELYKEAKAPALIYQESNMVIRFLRDYFDTDMDAVVVDNPKVFHEAKEFFQDVLPDYAGLVRLHRERRPIFSRFQIEEQIAAIAKNKVNLPSGGSIVIDATEALVAIDVNSGKTMGEGDIEKTAFKTNMEATTEIARQLRLRDLGGLIVIDLIDMREKNHIREVEKSLKEALSKDKARVNLGRISKFGLLEMSRQRIKTTLGEKSYLPCPYCQGSGQLKRVEALAIAFLRKLEAGLAREDIEKAEGETALETALYLLNEKRDFLAELEKKYKTVISVKGRPELKPDVMEINFQRTEKAAFQKPAEEEKSLRKTEDTPLAPPQAAPEKASEVSEKPSAAPDAGTRKKTGSRRSARKKPAAKTPVQSPSAEKPSPVPVATSPQPVVDAQALPETPRTDPAGQEDMKSPEPKNAASAQENKAGGGIKPAETNTDKTSPPRRKSRPRRKPVKKTEEKDGGPETKSVSPEGTGEKPGSEEVKSAKPAAKSRPRPSRSRQPSRNKPTPKQSSDDKEKTPEKGPSPKPVAPEEGKPQSGEPAGTGED